MAGERRILPRTPGQGGRAHGGPQGQIDSFISYTRTNWPWAEWMAWQLKEAGSSVVLQAWDMIPGLDFLHEMQKAATTAKRTLAVLLPAYFTPQFGEVEWRVARGGRYQNGGEKHA
jgi:hypothetical protein